MIGRQLLCRAAHTQRNLHTTRQKLARGLVIDQINPNVKKMEYAVRGPIVQRATAIQDELAAGNKKPFTYVVRANIGDCHATGQKPLTFLRQVVAAATYPELMQEKRFPSDVVDRAQRVLSDCGGNSLGAYSDSAGVRIIRRDVADYISNRDGFPCDWNNVFLSTGASDGIKTILQMLNCPGPNNEISGILVPIPQYPLYSATLAEYDMKQINYYLDEDNQWALSVPELERSLAELATDTVPRAIVVINPGNPTGQVLSKQNIIDIIKFSRQNNLMILADEVYQHNVYADECEFHSFKKVLSELGYDDVQLASFMSTSKGYMGECGYRGGYCEITNIDADVKLMITKLTSAKLCSSISGQLVMECVVNPPKPDEPSYQTFVQERDGVLRSLKKKAELVMNTLNSVDGITCNQIQGAMYCFPKLDLPEKLVAAAKERGVAADSMYCFELLEKTGLCVVPGSGFGQRPGTHHFRCTILPQEEQFSEVMKRFKSFHDDFIKQWS